VALNIGNINFGVDANTAGLQKAIAALNRFQKKTDQVAKSQVKGSQQAAAAMSRQESAIKKAFQQTIQLQNQLRKAGVPPEQIAAVSNAFKRLTKELTSGKISIVEFNRSVDAFNAKMGRSKRQLNDFGQAANKGKTGLAKYTTAFRDLESSAVLALGPLSGLGARIRSVSAIIGRSAGMMGLWIAAIAGVVIGLGTLGAAAIRAGAEMKSLTLRFEAATGSSAAGGRAFKFVIALSRKLGLEVGVLTKSYSRFLAAAQGTNIEGAKAQKIFTQVARAAAALKLDAQDVEGVMRAIEQIMSKGTVQAEELRGQLGDRLPGAFRIAADAMGVTTRELNRMLKAGEVISDEFLPKFTEALNEAVGKNAEKNLSTLSGAFNLLKTNTSLVLADIDDFTMASKAATSLTLAFADAMGGLAGEADFLDEAVEEATEEIEKFRIAIDGTRRSAVELSGAFSKINENVDESLAELLVFQEALGFFGRAGNDIQKLLDFFEVLPTLAKASADDFTVLAEKLAFALGRPVEASAQGIGEAMAEVARKINEAGESVERIKNTPVVLKEINDELALMRERAAALAEGPEAAEHFDNVTESIRALEASMEDTILTTGKRTALTEEWEALLIRINILEDENTEIVRKREKAIKDAARAQEKAEKGILKANEALEIMRSKVAAIGTDPDSLEIFTKVEAPLIRFRQRLEEAGVAQTTIVELTREYNELLNIQFQATNRLARAADAMAAATTNAFEDIILKGGDVKEMLKELGRELLRIWLRAMVLDQLQSAMGSSGFFGSIFSNIGNAGATTSGGGGGLFKGTFAHGGSFKLPGSGGSDKVPFAGVGKPGEVVSVARPDQISARRGSGGGVTVIQNNSFEGGSFDPEILIPILDENNRKVTADVLDAMDRGTYN
jgi:tape measure domain-containing protein